MHPNNHEYYFICLLLHNVHGPTSFENLKTVDNILYPTFKAMCQSLDHLESDSHWNDTLSETSVAEVFGKLREFFYINVGVLQYL